MSLTNQGLRFIPFGLVHVGLDSDASIKQFGLVFDNVLRTELVVSLSRPSPSTSLTMIHHHHQNATFVLFSPLFFAFCTVTIFPPSRFTTAVTWILPSFSFYYSDNVIQSWFLKVPHWVWKRTPHHRWKVPLWNGLHCGISCNGLWNELQSVAMDCGLDCNGCGMNCNGLWKLGTSLPSGVVSSNCSPSW